MWQRSPKTLGDTAADAKQQRNQPQPNPEHRGCKISTSVFPATKPLAGSNEYYGLLRRTSLSCAVHASERTSNQEKQKPINQRFCVSIETTLPLILLAYIQCLLIKWSCAILTSCLSPSSGGTMKIQPVTYLLGFFVSLLSTSERFDRINRLYYNRDDLLWDFHN